MEKLLLIDGNSLINRAFYAMPILSTKNGTFTNAVYGFMNMFFKVLSDEKPTHAVVAFDVKAPTFRHQMFEDYKGTRKPMPEELRPQIPLLKEVLSLMNITVIEKPGSEADDIIGTIAKHTDIQTLIYTGDKDSFQLVDEQTEVHFTKRGITDVEIYTLQNFKEKTGLVPSQIIDLKSLMGDASDNIPGVSGIGEKTAKNLLEQFFDLDNLYKNTDKLSGKLKEKIESGKDMAYLSKRLATIDCDCGVCTDTSTMKIVTPFSSKVKEKFIELEFKSLYKKEEWFAQSITTKTPKREEKTQNVKVVKISDFSEFNLINLPKRLALILDNKGANISDGEKEYILPIKKGLFDEGFSLSEVLEKIKPLFSEDYSLIVFNKKALMHYLKSNSAIQLKCQTDDISLMKYLADFSGKEESVYDLIEEYGLDKTSPATSIFTAYNSLSNKLDEENMTKLYKEVELPLCEVLFDMEVSGFKVDYEALCLAGEKYRKDILEIESQIREMANAPDLNLNSPKKLGELLFNQLKIGKGKKTKTGFSTSAEVLESLENAHPIVPLILKYRGLQKIQSTYIEGFKPLIEKNTGLIHTSFNQTVTATGRLSSKEPNLQNIPVRDDESKEIRRFFVPKSEDRILITADYSQIELRLLAAFSECKGLISAFKEGVDVHSVTASKVFGVPIKEVTPKMRSQAKAVNFGIIYGISEYGLAKQLKIEPFLAREYILAYFKEYPEVKEYMDKNVAFAKENGYAITLLKRRRYIKELALSNFALRQFGERVAMNMPLQGSSADIIKLAMLGVSKRLKQEGLKSELILQVHDELIIDALKEEEDKVKRILVEEMEGATKLSVALTVSVGEGQTWFDAK